MTELFKDGIINTIPQMYDYFRETLMDAKLPIPKIVGFKIVSPKRQGVMSIVERHVDVKENMLKLSSNLGKVIFLPTIGSNNKLQVPNIINTVAQKPNFDTSYPKVYSSPQFFNREGTEIGLVKEDIYLYTPQDEVTLRVAVCAHIGHLTFEESTSLTNKVVGNDNAKDYLAIVSTFSLKDYIRVLPPQPDGKIHYRLYNGMTDEKMNLLWKYGKEVEQNGLYQI